jgi:hypothetical protein
MRTDIAKTAGEFFELFVANVSKNIFKYGKRLFCDIILGSSLLIIIRMIKSKRIRWAGHVAHMGNIRNENK